MTSDADTGQASRHSPEGSMPTLADKRLSPSGLADNEVSSHQSKKGRHDSSNNMGTSGLTASPAAEISEPRYLAPQRVVGTLGWDDAIIGTVDPVPAHLLHFSTIHIANHRPSVRMAAPSSADAALVAKKASILHKAKHGHPPPVHAAHGHGHAQHGSHAHGHAAHGHGHMHGHRHRHTPAHKEAHDVVSSDTAPSRLDRMLGGFNSSIDPVERTPTGRPLQQPSSQSALAPPSTNGVLDRTSPNQHERTNGSTTRDVDADDDDSNPWPAPQLQLEE